MLRDWVISGAIVAVIILALLLGNFGGGGKYPT
jgi:hypothetical protein